jgi:hypothetical protein
MKISRTVLSLAVAALLAPVMLADAAPASAAWSGWTRLRTDYGLYVTDTLGTSQLGMPVVRPRDNVGTAQAWFFQAITTPGWEGFYKIGNATTSGCLHRMDTDVHVNVGACDSSYAVRWKAIPGTRAGTIRLASAVDGRCLTYLRSDNSPVYAWPCDYPTSTEQDLEAVA